MIARLNFYMEVDKDVMKECIERRIVLDIGGTHWRISLSLFFLFFYFVNINLTFIP